MPGPVKNNAATISSTHMMQNAKEKPILKSRQFNRFATPYRLCNVVRNGQNITNRMPNHAGMNVAMIIAKSMGVVPKVKSVEGDAEKSAIIPPRMTKGVT